MRFYLRTLGFALLALPLLLLSACDSAEEDPPRVGLTGLWTGELEYTADASQVFDVELTLSDTRDNITGSGSVALPDGPLDFSVVSGLFSGTVVTLELIFDRPPQGTLSGNVNAARDEINGTMGGPGFANGDVLLRLQRSN